MLVKGRALGLGVMGWHSFLQQKGLPFNSIASTAHTKNIFSDIRGKAEKASMDLALEYGEPLWCRGTGMRNTHLLALLLQYLIQLFVVVLVLGLNLYLLIFILLMVLKVLLLEKIKYYSLF